MYRYMEVSELKKLIKNSTAVLVLDNGDPSMVILDYNLYKDLVAEKEQSKDVRINNASSVNSLEENRSGNGHQLPDTALLDKLNREILALKNQIEMEEKSMNSQSIDSPSFE